MKSLALAAMYSIGLTISYSAKAEPCSQRQNIRTEKLVRAYMVKNSLIKPEEEQHLPELGISTRWALHKTVKTPFGCFAVTRILSQIGNQREWLPESNAFGIVFGNAGQPDRIVSFQTLRPVARSVIAKIGLKGNAIHPRYGRVTNFYVKLDGQSAIEATKSLDLNLPYAGFNGIAVRGSKAPYDPTPNRNWHIQKGTYSLRRGDSGEEMDIQAFQLDGMDESGAEAYWGGRKALQVAPWGQSFVHSLRNL